MQYGSYMIDLNKIFWNGAKKLIYYFQKYITFKFKNYKYVLTFLEPFSRLLPDEMSGSKEEILVLIYQ